MFVFVYGTLKRGFPNHRVMEHAVGEFIGEGVTTAPTFDMTSLGAFPALLPEGKFRIIGEVYDVEDISPLDHLEGYPHFYDRKIVPISCCGLQYGCWTYFMHDIPKDIDNTGINIEMENLKVLPVMEVAYDAAWYCSSAKEWTGKSSRNHVVD